MSESTTTNFKISPANVLGLDHQEYVCAVRALALSKPAEYFELRAQVLRSVKRDAVSNLYNTLFAVLSAGTDLQGRPIGKLGTSGYKPMYPGPKINDFSIQVASDLADHLNRCIDIILPEDFEQIAERKLNLKGRANVIE
jgi:hypothetical protein